MSVKLKAKKEKSKVSKLIEKSDSENDENEHELSYFINDRVKLMKEVLKIIKPKKIKSMAPDCIKDLDTEEINSMLLEELLGISNKRLKYIFSGQNLGEDSSSTDPEEEKPPIDVISLDDVSDDEFVIEVDSDKSKKKYRKVKEEPRTKKIKKEKSDRKNKQKDGPLEEENLMSVLELLELQARARAIRSQLMIEANKKTSQSSEVKANEDSDDDDIIIEVPKHEEIVINSSESETEQHKQASVSKEKSGSEVQPKKITLIRDRFSKQSSSEASVSNEVHDKSAGEIEASANVQPETSKSKPQEQDCVNDEDEIILIVDQEEMEGIIGD